MSCYSHIHGVMMKPKYLLQLPVSPLSVARLSLSVVCRRLWAGSHGSCVHQNKYSVQDDECKLQALLTEGIFNTLTSFCFVF